MTKIFSTKKESERNPNQLKQSRCSMKKKGGTKIQTENTNRASCYLPDKPKTPAMERAERIQDKLPLDSISLIRDMQISHVSGGFWLGLKLSFCEKHLPPHDEMIDLVVDGVDEKKWAVKYLAYKNGLSGGWKGFSVAHGLVEGDVLVFELIEPHKFKVHIVRASEPTTSTSKTDKDSAVHDAPPIDHQPKMMTSATMHGETATKKHFEDVKCFEDFKIKVNGSVLGAEIPTEVMRKYHNLCKSQNKFLHENLVEGLESKEAARVISEMVHIADAIGEATPITDLHSYRETLESFEGLGMAVGFLRAKIDLVSDHLFFLKSKEQEKKHLEARLADIWNSAKQHNREIQWEKKKFEVALAKTAWTK